MLSVQIWAVSGQHHSRRVVFRWHHHARLKCAMYRLYLERSACSLRTADRSVSVWLTGMPAECVKYSLATARPGRQALHKCLLHLQLRNLTCWQWSCSRRLSSTLLASHEVPTCRAAACQSRLSRGARAATARKAAAAAGGSQMPAYYSRREISSGLEHFLVIFL